MNPVRCGSLVIALVGAALGGTLSAAALAAAADTKSPVLPEVAVIAPRPPTAAELAGDSVSNFVATHGRPSVVIKQLPRWDTGICPAAFGLEPAFNSFVVARIRAVADTVGAPTLDPHNCKANVQIFFSTDPESTIDRFAKQVPAALGFHYRTETGQVKQFNHPIQGWYITETRGDDTSVIVDDPMPFHLYLTDPSPKHLGSRVPGARLGTHLTTGRNSWLVHVLVVADLTKVVGYTVGSIADYLAVTILSQTRLPDTCGQLPSILDLMAPKCDDGPKPEAVTAGDLAFLRALYKLDLRVGLDLEQADLRNNMMRQFATRN